MKPVLFYSLTVSQSDKKFTKVTSSMKPVLFYSLTVSQSDKKFTKVTSSMKPVLFYSLTVSQSDKKFTKVTSSMKPVLFYSLTVSQSDKKFLVNYWIEGICLTVFTTVWQLSLSWRILIHFSHCSSLRSVLIQSLHLRLGRSDILFLSRFCTKTL